MVNDWLGRHRGYIFVTLLNLAFLGAALFYLRRPHPQPIVIITPTPVPTPTPAMLMVYISGAVVKPDVYAVPEGSRVKEAVEAAGGFTSEADSDRINLASPLNDGEHVYVPRVGEETSPISPTGMPSGSPSGGKVNINRATVVELDALPGIGPAYAQRIIDYREANGPFESIEEIKKVRGIGEAIFEQVKDLITVR
ncbi:MAG: helix-hairpin-helix domain-containing protein [Anaerolineae bacterium]